MRCSTATSGWELVATIPQYSWPSLSDRSVSSFSSGMPCANVSFEVLAHGIEAVIDADERAQDRARMPERRPAEFARLGSADQVRGGLKQQSLPLRLPPAFADVSKDDYQPGYAARTIKHRGDLDLHRNRRTAPVGITVSKTHGRQRDVLAIRGGGGHSNTRRSPYLCPANPM
jgi:hypothetical protein